MLGMLEEKIEGTKKRLCLAVLGSGYVGLPTAALFAGAGFCVTAIDVKPAIVESVNQGISPINEPGLQELISKNVKAAKLNATFLSSATLKNKHVIIVAVQTPIDKNKKPNLSFLTSAIETIGENLKKGMLVVICSTMPPGTLQGRVKPLLEAASGMKADIDFYLAYVPERIAPGKALKELVESPRLVGGIGFNSTKMAMKLFGTICKRLIATDATTAEVAKTAENTFRDVNIAFANQLALICEQHGADVAKVVELANTHPRVKIHSPGPGVGGPCLTKDPYLLVHGTNFENANVIKAARETNDYMPHHMVELALKGLKCVGKRIDNSTVVLLGTSYKAEVDDPRLSPSEPIIRKIMELGAETIVYDPYCIETFGAKKANSLLEAVKGADCLILAVDHPEFRNLNLQTLKEFMNVKPIIIDGKRLIDPTKAEKIGFKYFAIGYGKPPSNLMNNEGCFNLQFNIFTGNDSSNTSMELNNV
jgi:UDP-N-acetyl-D-mannosaminuronic acid dehydrogenase